MKRLVSLAAVAMMALVVVGADELPLATPEEMHMRSGDLHAIEASLKKYQQSGRIPGADVIVTRGGKQVRRRRRKEEEETTCVPPPVTR